MWAIHTRGYGAALTREGPLTPSSTMGLEDTVLRETSQPQRDKDCMTPCLWGLRGARFTDTESGRGRPGRRRGGEWVLHGDRVQCEDMKKSRDGWGRRCTVE